MEAQVTALENRLAEVCGHLNVLHAQLVDLVVEALDQGLWEQAGIRSPEHWLSWKAGVSPHTARNIVTIARRRPDLPVTGALFANGELSADQMAVVAVHTRAVHDAQVAQIAPYATVSQLRIALGRYQHADPSIDSPADSPADPAPAEQPVDRITFGYDHRNRFTLHADLSPEIGACFEQAIREVRDHLVHRPDSGPITWTDALIEMCGRSLSTITSTTRADRYRIYLHLDTEGAWIQNGPTLPQAIIDNITCDGIIQPVWHTAGLPVNVGRAQRVFPNHTRRLILDRDRHCTAPGCTSTVNLHIHHIIHWTKGGPTTTANGLTLCSRHHRALHDGQLNIAGNADQPHTLTFTDQHGRTIPTSAQPRPPTEPPPAPPPGHHYTHPTGEPFDTRWFHLHDPPTAAA